MITVYLCCEDCEEEIGASLNAKSPFAALIDAHELVCEANQNVDDEEDEED
jgi:hypothetical protein